MICGFTVSRCPFCGRNQPFLHLRSATPCYVRCVCGACGPHSADPETAVRLWNERKGDGCAVGGFENASCGHETADGGSK